MVYIWQEIHISTHSLELNKDQEIRRLWTSQPTTMKSFAVCGAVSFLLLALSASSLASDCDDSLPKPVCDHLERLENRMVRLANRSTILISKAVENAAERNAKLFERAVQIIKNATKVRPDMNSTELVKLLKELTETFEKVKAAQQETAEKAVKAVEAASMKVAKLIQKIIDDAVDADHSDIHEFRRKLHRAVMKAHMSIRKATYEAVKEVSMTSMKARMYVVRMLKKLGLGMVADVMPVVDSLMDAADAKEADAAEKEIEADFDSAANEAYEVIVRADGGVSKRGWNEFWAKVKAKFQQLGALILQKIKEAAQTIAPQIYEKLRQIGKLLLDTAKQVIVEIAGQIFVIVKNSV